jgi:hypothetical protein
MTRILPCLVTKVLLLAALLDAFSAWGQAAPGPGLALYRELANPVFDVSNVYRIRDVLIEREDLHIALSDGTIGIMRAVDGHVTGAVFEGVGQILLVPPNRAERVSLGLFTGSAVLEETFSSAYLRFFDNKMLAELKNGFRKPEDAEEFIARWEPPFRTLARADTLPILRAMTNSQDPNSFFLHLRVGGTRLGVFDIVIDANAPEQVSVGQERMNNQTAYFDSWLSLPARSTRQASGPSPVNLPRFDLSDYRIQVKVQPPTDLSAEAEFTVTPRRIGQRTMILELSRYLRVTSIRTGDQQLEFIQNEALTGSDLARRGDDLVAIVFPSALEVDHPVRLTVSYSGPVMFSAGDELLYVGARGTWYPNYGPSYDNYDLTFDYPDDWSLVATGKPAGSTVQNGRRKSRFVTEKPIARAGFNLGKFETAAASSGNVAIHAYATKTVERELAAAEARAGRRAEPAREVKQIADRAAANVQFLSAQLDPFPYSNLEITQLPGIVSQSWPGLIYLSSMAFLDRNDRQALGVRDPYIELLLSRLMLGHETAHQWWGDAVDWVSYRDEWIIEALANYCALLMLEKEDPQATRVALDYYKNQLLKETASGPVKDAGPVTLGVRLTSSKFPEAYERVLYGRGTWLFHMLRTMLRQADGKDNDALFFSALKSLLAKAPNHKISTRDLQLAFEQVLPASLRYENKKSLDWFFDSWVNDVSIPQLSLQDVHLTPSDGKIKAKGVIETTHGAKDLVMAVPVYAVDESGKPQFLAFVFSDEPKSEFALTAPAGTKQLLLDPENTILRR